MNATVDGFARALSDRRSGAPVVVPHVVGGAELFEGALINREDPSHPALVVSACHDASPEIVRRAVSAARFAQREWARVPLRQRIERMRPAAAFIEANLEQWALRVALEIGKARGAAIAEAREVLDILNLYLGYAAEPGALEDERASDPNGLANASVLRPYGVFGIIAPFNYPIVQAANAVIAALLAGNGVVVKTSHQGPWSGHAVHEMCAVMDLPAGLVNIVHGADEPGRALASADIDGISFTGSVGVGMAILRQLGGGAYPRPVIAEMGGKNPVIVTETADLEAAAAGIVFSAFDLSGQKCSALSRVLVAEDKHDQLVALLCDRIAKLRVGGPEEPEAFAGPLVDARALERFQSIVKQARVDGFDVAGGDRLDRDGYFVQPAIVSNVPADHALAVTEHFAPFLTVSKTRSFDEALELANATDMGLTAGIYTGDIEEGRSFLERIEAGCVNVNVPGHATTGWWPGPQTFGGWKASGSTGKQGHGRWYIQQFARQQSRKAPKALEAMLHD